MPIYEYQCLECGHEMEVLQKISDASLTDCPQCGAAKLRKKVSAAAFRLKGGGWYETDFKTGNKKNLHGAAETAASSDKAPASSNKVPASSDKAPASSDKAPSTGDKPSTTGSSESSKSA